MTCVDLKVRKCIFENVKGISLRNALANMLQHEICSPLPLNKIAQRISQHCTKLHNEVHKVLQNEIS